MALFILIIAIILVTAAVRNSQADLFTALKTDVPAFGVWAAAIVAVGLVGFIPGLKPISRGLLGLVILVIVLNNYQNIISGFSSAVAGSQKGASTSTGSSATTSLNGAIDSASSFAHSVDNADPTGLLSAIDSFGSYVGIGAAK